MITHLEMAEKLQSIKSELNIDSLLLNTSIDNQKEIVKLKQSINKNFDKAISFCNKGLFSKTSLVQKCCQLIIEKIIYATKLSASSIATEITKYYELEKEKRALEQKITEISDTEENAEQENISDLETKLSDIELQMENIKKSECSEILRLISELEELKKYDKVEKKTKVNVVGDTYDSLSDEEREQVDEAIVESENPESSKDVNSEEEELGKIKKWKECKIKDLLLKVKVFFEQNKKETITVLVTILVVTMLATVTPVNSNQTNEDDYIQIVATATTSPEKSSTEEIPEEEVAEEKISEEEVVEEEIPEEEIVEEEIPEEEIHKEKIPEEKIPEEKVPETEITEKENSYYSNNGGSVPSQSTPGSNDDNIILETGPIGSPGETYIIENQGGGTTYYNPDGSAITRDPSGKIDGITEPVNSESVPGRNDAFSINPPAGEKPDDEMTENDEMVAALDEWIASLNQGEEIGR